MHNYGVASSDSQLTKVKQVFHLFQQKFVAKHFIVLHYNSYNLLNHRLRGKSCVHFNY